MFREISLGLVIAVLFATVQSGHGLQCWKCSSIHDVTCRDYFNITKIELNRRYFDNSNYGNRQIQPVRTDPHVETCDEMYTSSFNQKNVCIKVVFKGVHGLQEVNRGCRLVTKTLKSGECPEDMRDKAKEYEFCGTCESDQCNAATGIKTNALIAAIPTLLAIYFRK